MQFSLPKAEISSLLHNASANQKKQLTHKKPSEFDKKVRYFLQNCLITFSLTFHVCPIQKLKVATFKKDGHHNNRTNGTKSVLPKIFQIYTIVDDQKKIFLYYFILETCLSIARSYNEKKVYDPKLSSSYHLSVECFSQLSFDSEVYTKSAAVADFVYTSESNKSCEKQSTQR